MIQKDKKTGIETKRVAFVAGNIGFRFKGNKIVDVEPNSQAEKNGICKGWIILEVNNEKQRDSQQGIFEAIKKAVDFGSGVEILFQRKP